MNYVTSHFYWLVLQCVVNNYCVLCTVKGQKSEQEHTTKDIVGFHKHSPLLTLTLSMNCHWEIVLILACEQAPGWVDSHSLRSRVHTSLAEFFSALAGSLFAGYINTIHTIFDSIFLYHTGIHTRVITRTTLLALPVAIRDSFIVLLYGASFSISFLNYILLVTVCAVDSNKDSLFW